MAKRVRSAGKISKPLIAAKQAAKKKSKGAAKFHSEKLRATLDNQASTVYNLNQIPKNVGSPPDISSADLLSLVSTMGRL